ncbi:unnamed protein product, partial [Cyprideis torosa]
MVKECAEQQVHSLPLSNLNDLNSNRFSGVLLTALWERPNQPPIPIELTARRTPLKILPLLEVSVLEERVDCASVVASAKHHAS